MKQLCPRCKGKGWVRSWEFLCFTVYAPIALIVDAGDSLESIRNGNCTTKKECPLCEGEKFIQLD